MPERRTSSGEHRIGSEYSFSVNTRIQIHTRFGPKLVGVWSPVNAVLKKINDDMGLFEALGPFDAHYTFDDGRESQTYPKDRGTQFLAFLSNAHLEKNAEENWIQATLP